MIIIYCSKQQQNDAVTPSLAHRSHTCMRALALGQDTQLRTAQLGTGGRCVSPLRRVVSMVLCGSARLLSLPACSTSPPVFMLGFAAGCIG